MKALAIYAAAAWGLLQVVEFAVVNYGLSRFLLDSAVIAAFGGGMITAVLVWHHGAVGSQTATKSEIAIVGTVVLVTMAGVLFLAQNDPVKIFETQEGFRLVFELQQNIPEEDGLGTAGAGPPEGWHWTEEGGIHMNPDHGKINWPGLSVEWEGYPVRLQELYDMNHLLVTVVLPSEPGDISDLLEFGSNHRSAIITSTNLEISIQIPFEARRLDSGVHFSTHNSNDVEQTL